MSIDLEAIRRRAAVATEGPWEIGFQMPEYSEEVWTVAGGMVFGDSADGYAMGNPADALFIAAARTDIPALLAEVDRLNGIIAEAMARSASARVPVTAIGELAAIENILARAKDQAHA